MLFIAVPQLATGVHWQQCYLTESSLTTINVEVPFISLSVELLNDDVFKTTGNEGNSKCHQPVVTILATVAAVLQKATQSHFKP